MSFEDRLLHELHAHAERPARTRSSRRPLLGAAVALAAAASAAIAFLPGSTQAPASAAQIIRAVQQADDVVIHANQITHGADGVDYRSEMWFGPQGFRTLEYDAQGKPVLDTAQRGGDYRQVDLAAGTYTQTTVPEAKPYDIAAQFRKSNFTLIGRERMDGHDVLHLRDDEPGMGREVWVDAHRYLPLRMVENLARIDYEWLPDDASTAKLLWPDLSDGVRRVEAPPVKEKKKVR
jgi:hypothetical protein